MHRWRLTTIAAVCCLSLFGCARLPALSPLEEMSAPATAATTAPIPSVTVTVEGGSAEVGDTVILPVTVSADAHLVDADVLLQYNPSLLEPVLQYDAATDSERYAEPGVFAGTVRSEKLCDGVLYVMLASADNGVEQKGTLFYVAFRLLSAKADSCFVTLEVPSCHLRVGTADCDAVAAGKLSLREGTVTLKQPTEVEKATKTGA